MCRFVWTIPLQTLKGLELTQAFKSIFENGRKLIKLRTDKGVEFVNKYVKAYLKQQNIDHFVTQNEVKAKYSERAIKTIRSRLTKYLKKNRTKTWEDELQNVINSYNATKHSTTHKAPRDVNKEDEHEIWQLNYAPKPERYYKYRIKSISNKNNEKFKFNVSDIVKISNLRGVFDKEYTSRWTNETQLL